MIRLFPLLALALLLAAPACAQTYTGALEPGDATLNQGEFYDSYDLDVRAGDWVEADMTSSEFDTYLVVVAPSGENEQNDDHEGSTGRSYLRFQATESGTYRVLATSYAGGERGRYRLQLGRDGERGGVLPAGLLGGDRGGRGGARIERGRLERGDATLNSGEFRDQYTFEGRAGQAVVLDLRSQEFDPYLILAFPGGGQEDNDDHEGDLRRSLISMTLPETGTYRVLVTSYQPGETGAYDLTMTGLGGDDGGTYAPASGRRAERGALAQGDETLREGEFYDTFSFEGAPGQRVRLDLTSDAFDTYLVLQPPRGENVQNDDFEGDLHHSRIEMDLSEPGTYTVYVTSYAARETGPYELVMDVGRGDRPTRGDPGAGTPVAALPPPRDASRLALDQAVEGSLDRGDQLLSSGEFVDLHAFDGEAGEPVRIDLTSAEFDAYLILTTPDGEQIDNDDVEAGNTNARLEFVMPASGGYQVRVTSYQPGETGRYQLRISQADAMTPATAAAPNVVGLFVGISDYPGEGNDLPYTASDATLVRDALVNGVGMRAADAIVLTDAQATRERFRAALADLARRADDRTTLVLFYSGHGNQQARPGGPDAADPDGRDETLSLYDGDVIDDELARMLDAFRGGRQLVVLDACYSGGFSKDVVSRPGRMGLFSSEEDILSAVASKFEAGGYLSYFFADALAERRADEDRNGAVTALELSTYLRERYEGDVRDEGPAAVRAGQTRLDQQELVVDRGSVGPFDTVFTLR